MDLHQLYDYGYQEVPKIETIETIVKGLNAVLLDIRFSPKSSQPSFMKSALEERFGEYYQHNQDLGNRTFKSTGVEIVNIEAGSAAVIELLKLRPVILMCACWNRVHCHRLSVVSHLENVYGIASTPLTRQLSKDLLKQFQPGQLSFFEE